MSRPAWAAFLYAISIHAPRVGSDPGLDVVVTDPADISIHAPRVGSDPQPRRISGGSHYFYPRSPCGERRLPTLLAVWQRIFLSTLPVWGATGGDHIFRQAQCTFLSTLPVWGATKVGPQAGPGLMISIHAPRVGSDKAPTTPHWTGSISIHAPRVGSDSNIMTAPVSRILFLSTLPVWGATTPARAFTSDFWISIHAPRVGSDSKSAQKKCALLFFCTKLTVHTSDFVQIHRRIPDKF